MKKIQYLVVTGIPSPGDTTEPFRDLLVFIGDVGMGNHTFHRMNKRLYEPDHEAMITFKDQNDYLRFKLAFSNDFKITACYA